MVDTISIIFSTLMVVIVVIRAMRLDAREPWFAESIPVPESTQDSAASLLPKLTNIQEGSPRA